MSFGYFERWEVNQTALPIYPVFLLLSIVVTFIHSSYFLQGGRVSLLFTVLGDYLITMEETIHYRKGCVNL